MAANDVICQGALPVVYTDEIAAGKASIFLNENYEFGSALLVFH